MDATNVEIVVLRGEEVQERWSEVEEAMRKAFVGSEFNDGCGVWRPLDCTMESSQPEVRSAYRHVVALHEGKIVGAWFRIPVEKSHERDWCDPGWFFTSSEFDRRFSDGTGSPRAQVADAIVNKAHEMMRAAGFTRIVTNMGTVAGARFMQRRHGYIHQPRPEKANTWLKVL